MAILCENPEYLQSQLITYIGNKRALLDFIGKALSLVQKDLGKEKLNCLDIFAGSGIVSRYLKRFSSSITVNDLEIYASIISRCYLTNISDIDLEKLQSLHHTLTDKIDDEIAKNPICPGFITELYSPSDENNIQKGDRCFYTNYNARYLDIARQLIDKEVDDSYRDFFIAPLLSEASIHANTAGIFKGFYYITLIMEIKPSSSRHITQHETIRKSSNSFFICPIIFVDSINFFDITIDNM